MNEPKTSQERGAELGKAISVALNSYDYSEIIKATVEQLADSHRTLQQCVTQLCFEWLRHLARQEALGRFDLRNQAACEWAAKIVQVIGPDGALPFI